MKIFTTVMTLTMSVFCMYSHAEAFQASVIPPTVKPGDAFIIRIKDVKDSAPPVAKFNNKTFFFSSCGEDCFVAIGAVDLDTKPGKYSIEFISDEEKSGLNFVVSRVDFPTIYLTLPDEKVFLSPENQERADREAERLNVIWQTISDKLWDGNFIMPLETKISTVFGTKRIMNKKKISVHKGVDLKGKGGEAVKAFNSGRVVLAEELFFGGNTIILDHGQGIFSIYMHLSMSKTAVGDIVSKGDTMGLVGSSGRATGPHLHFGVKIHDVNLNPISLVKLKL